MTRARATSRLIKGIAYFRRWEDAHATAAALCLTRIIPYGRGWAIQYRVSGPYWPQEEPGGAYVRDSD